MQSSSVTIDFPIKLLRYQLKEYLEYNFKVYIKKDDTDITVFGSPTDVNLCQEHAEYFKSLDSQFLLHLNSFTKQALGILNLKLFYQSKCKVLMTVDEDVLYIFGQLFNVTCIYNYLCHHTAIIENDPYGNLTELERMDLNVMCRQLNVVLNDHLWDKSRKFIYNILKNGDDLFGQFGDQLKTTGSQNSTDLALNVPIDNLNLLDIAADNNKKKLLLEMEVDKFVKTTENDGLSLLDHSQDNKAQKSRTVIIDGSNVAFEHGNGNFSPLGVKFAVDYFINRGSQKVYALLPRHRQGIGAAVFPQMEHSDNLKYTPSRKINNVRETPYDDRFILDAALALDGVVLSNDQYRDLMSIEKYRDIICKRLIPYTFVEDHIIVPDDPRGPNGPTLEDLLNNKTTSTNEVKKSPRPVPIPPNHFRKRRQSQSNSKQNCASSSTPMGFFVANNSGGAGGGVINGANGTGVNGGSGGVTRPHKGGGGENFFKNHHQNELFRRVHEIFPSDGDVIRQVISSNPQLNDVTKIVNLVMIATGKKL